MMRTPRKHQVLLNPVDAARRRELAVEAGVDPRTIEKALTGASVKGMAGHRARAVLRLHRLIAKAGAGAIDVSDGDASGKGVHRG